MKDCMVEELKNAMKRNNVNLYVRQMNSPKENYIFPKMCELLHQSGEFEIFNNKMQFIGSSGNPMNFDELTKWLIIRAQKTSAEQAIDELIKYSENGSFEVRNILWLDGVYLEKEYKLADNIYLCPENSFMNEQFNKMLNGIEISKVPTIIPSAYLYEKVNHPKIHRFEDEEPKFIRFNYDKLEPVMLLMHLLRNDGVEAQAIASSYIVDESVPHRAGFSYVYLKYQPLFRNRQFIELEINNLMLLHDLYNKLDGTLMIRVKFILKLLLAFENETEYVQKAIHLRVLLESLYLDPDENDKSDNLVNRIVGLHGDNVVAANKLRRIVKDVYHDSSKAIHSGQISENGIKRCERNFSLMRNLIKTDIYVLIKNEV